MSWTKDAESRAPKTVYAAPETMRPLVAIVFDPGAVCEWSMEYDYLTGPDETQASVESVMGL